MVSPQASDVARVNGYYELCDHDPGGTSATLLSADGGSTIKYLDMKDFGRALFGVGLTIPASSSGITQVELVASAAATFSSVVVVKDTGTIDADAVMDQVWLECAAEELAQLGSDNGVELRYVTARITCSNTGDEAVAAMIGLEPRYAYDGLTPATTIA